MYLEERSPSSSGEKWIRIGILCGSCAAIADPIDICNADAIKFSPYVQNGSCESVVIKNVEGVVHELGRRGAAGCEFRR
jgi:hypothetical protein